MSDKIKVYNPQKFDVGIITQDKPAGVNIKSGSFALITQDDVDFLASTCTLFQRGILKIEADKLEETMGSIGIDVHTDGNFITDEEIAKKLSGTKNAMSKWLGTVTEGYLLDRIYDIAKNMNLNADKIKLLQEKMPDRDFLGE